MNSRILLGLIVTLALVALPGAHADVAIQVDPLSADAALVASCDAYQASTGQGAIKWQWDMDGTTLQSRDGYRLVEDEEVLNNDIRYVFSASGHKTVTCTATYPDGTTESDTIVIRARVQDAPRGIVSGSNGVYTWRTDPVNAPNWGIDTELSVNDLPFVQGPGCDFGIGSLAYRGIIPQVTLDLRDTPGTWAPYVSVIVDGVNTNKLARGYIVHGNTQTDSSYFGYDTKDIVGTSTIGEAKVPVYHGIDYFPALPPISYRALEDIRVTGTYGPYEVTVANPPHLAC